MDMSERTGAWNLAISLMPTGDSKNGRKQFQRDGRKAGLQRWSMSRNKGSTFSGRTQKTLSKVLFFFFKSISYCAAQADLQLLILLPQCPKC
jgi:hypothetical protein